MIMLAAFLAGFAWGWLRAHKRGGDRLDKLQYGFAHGVALAIASLVVGILLVRTGILT